MMIQNPSQLPNALVGIPNQDQISHKNHIAQKVQLTEQTMNNIHHSVTALRNLSPDMQLKAQFVYYGGMLYYFIASTAFAGVAVIASLFDNAGLPGRRSTHWIEWERQYFHVPKLALTVRVVFRYPSNA
jgi:hypothetical protein